MSSPEERTHGEIQASKRERILEEAVAQFYARGFTATTLDDIAAGLGVTKPFIYAHFRSQTELLAALCTPTIELSLAAVANAANGRGAPTERLRRAMIDFAKVILSWQANIAIFFHEEKSLEPAALAEIDVLRKRFDRVLSKLLTEGVIAGEFQISDVKLAALAIGGMISWAYTWHRPSGRLGIDELCERMAELTLRMVGARTLPETHTACP